MHWETLAYLGIGDDSAILQLSVDTDRISQLLNEQVRALFGLDGELFDMRFGDVRKIGPVPNAVPEPQELRAQLDLLPITHDEILLFKCFHVPMGRAHGDVQCLRDLG
nr:hypothetical protein [Halocatena marina]